MAPTYRGAKQHYISITNCGASARGFDAPLWQPVEQQEKEAPGAQHPEANQGQPPTAQTVALELLQHVKRQKKKGSGN